MNQFSTYQAVLTRGSPLRLLNRKASERSSMKIAPLIRASRSRRRMRQQRPTKKAAGIWGIMRLLLVIIPCRVGSLYDHMINHTRIAYVCVINTHAGAGSDRG